jgi:hypothetical protein
MTIYKMLEFYENLVTTPEFTFLLLTLLELSLTLCNCFLVLSPSALVHRCSISPHRDAGDLCCVIGVSEAAAAPPTKVILSDDKLPYCAAKKDKQKTTLWGSRE